MWIETNPQLCTETGFYLCRSSTHQCKAVSPTDLPVFSKHPYYKSTSWGIESSCYLGGISTSQFSQGKRRRIWDVLQLRMNVKYLIFTQFYSGQRNSFVIAVFEFKVKFAHPCGLGQLHPFCLLGAKAKHEPGSPFPVSHPTKPEIP